MVSQPPTPDQGSLSVMRFNVPLLRVFEVELGHCAHQIRTRASELGEHYPAAKKNILRTENKSCTLLPRWPFVVGPANPVL